MTASRCDGVAKLPPRLHGDSGAARSAEVVERSRVGATPPRLEASR
jgi:hypothetical protein